MEEKEKNNKKVWRYIIIALDVALTLFLFVVSIIMLIMMPKDSNELKQMTGFIGYLVNNPTVYLYAFVLPLFILLILNVLYLIFWIKKNNEKDKVELKDLTPEEKAKLKAELLKDVTSDEKKDDK